VDKLISKFFKLNADEKPTLDVDTSQKVLEAALENNNQPKIPEEEKDHEREVSLRQNLFNNYTLSFIFFYRSQTKKVCIIHPSLQAPTHARAIDVKRVLILYNPSSGDKKGSKIADEARNMFLAASINV
jgi:hypothetical protein